MSASTLVTVFCDYPNCGRWRDEGIADTAAEARQNLRYYGWQVAVSVPWSRRTEDYCSLHPEGPPKPEHRGYCNLSGGRLPPEDQDRSTCNCVPITQEIH